MRPRTHTQQTSATLAKTLHTIYKRAMEKSRFRVGVTCTFGLKKTSIDGCGGMWCIGFLVASQLEFSMLADHSLPARR